MHWLKDAMDKVWHGSLPKDTDERDQTLTLMTEGFLRLHMDVENLPFSTFYPRFQYEDPNTWHDKLQEIKTQFNPGKEGRPPTE